MRKELLPIFFFLTAILMVTLIIHIPTIFGLDLSAFAFMIGVTSVEFLYELVAKYRGKSYIWKAVSRSFKDKLVFAICYILLWTIISLPLYLKMSVWWVFVAIGIGYFIAMLVFRLFGSQSMKENFPKDQSSLFS